MSSREDKAMDSIISSMLNSGAIHSCEYEIDQFVSPIFLTPKKNGDYRFILNLKSLNKFIEAPHFKMEDTRSVIHLIRKNSLMATIDLKDAYYLVPINDNCQKYLRFVWKNVMYEFSCLPFGLNVAPYVFTKILKPVISVLRQKGFSSVIYIDDLWLVADSFENCASNVTQTMHLLTKLGFLINYEKSVLEPKYEIQYLGFIFNSRRMIISLPESKRSNLIISLRNFVSQEEHSIRDLAKIIGRLIACRLAVPYGLLYTRHLERCKYLALNKFNGNYNSLNTLDIESKQDILWWVKNLPHCYTIIAEDQFDFTIYTDASKTGWGAAMDNSSTGGAWTEEESRCHINLLELLAIFLALKCYAKDLRAKRILLRVDNKTAIALINKMGGIQFPHLTSLAKEIWMFCEQRNLFIFASYIPSKENIVADKESRSEFNNEWKLNSQMFEFICENYGFPEFDLFASRFSKQCKKYASFKPDPGAEIVDAFSFPWNKKILYYAFPPFNLICRVLKKAQHDEANIIIVAPNWPSQPFYPLLMRLSKEKPLILKPNKTLLISSSRNVHPL